MVQHKDSINLAIIQADLHWENIDANLTFFANQIASIKEEIDLIVLPETFSTGFTMNVEEFADEDGKALDWMIRMAKDRNSHIAGSLIIKEKNLHFNRLYFVGPNGYIAHYDKRHLFRMGREQEFFSRGSERVIVSLGKFRILLQICYDLRFPVFARNRGDYDVILYVANWPTKRAFVWDSLLVARAIENQSYVIGANRSGIDGLGDGTCGKSCVIDAKGKKIARMQRAPGILISNLNLNSLNIFRKKFPVLQDRDDFEIKS